MNDLIDFAELKAAGLLPSPTRDTLELMQLCQSGDDDTGPLLDRIADVPALDYAVRALAGQNGREGTLAEALNTVGAFPTSQLALALDLLHQHRRGACADFNYTRYWSHAFAMACAAQALTSEMPVASGPELFCQGLLAGIGSLGLANARPRSYAKLLRDCREAPVSTLLRRESALYGYSHLSMGAALLRSWRLGHIYSDAVLCQEAPHMATDRHTRHLARLLQLASCMAGLYLAQPGERKALVAEMAATSSRLQLDTRVLLDIVDVANGNWRQWCNALDLQEHLPLAMQTAPVATIPTTAAAAA
ncbi:HDOD domain-containing protein [Pseudoduganella rivuli]|nr:HDOD domain-containing protein [Pseudoduganella rivuli]